MSTNRVLLDVEISLFVADLFGDADIQADTVSPRKGLLEPLLQYGDYCALLLQNTTQIPLGALNAAGKRLKVIGIIGDEIYIFMQWDDATKDDQHKPFIWNSAQNKYVAGEQREDRLALQFEMDGEYTVNWLSGNSFEADTWHWKAARSNPIGLVPVVAKLKFLQIKFDHHAPPLPGGAFRPAREGGKYI